MIDLPLAFLRLGRIHTEPFTGFYELECFADGGGELGLQQRNVSAAHSEAFPRLT